MNDSTHLAVTIGGVLLVAYIGLRQMRQRRDLPPRGLRPGSPEWHAAAQAALLAEFGPNAFERRGAFDSIGGTVACPSCREEYPAGTLFCDACAIETVELEELTPPAPAAPRNTATTTAASPDRAELVCVHVAESPMQALLYKTYLEGHSIPCVTNGHVPSGIYTFSITPLAEVRLFVRNVDAERARKLLRECK